MANAKICDRCNATMPETTYEEMMSRKYMLYIRNDGHDPRRDNTHDKADLCPICYDKLVKFMFEDEDE